MAVEESGERRRKTLDPKLDIVFWMLFGAEQNRALLISLLNAVLKPSEPIVSAEVLHAQPERSGVDEKSIALDLRIQLETGEQVDVEMQTQRRPAQRERALYYWARLYAGQALRGAPYENLRRCVVVLIANFVELSSPRFHSVFRVRAQPEGQLLTDHLELHVVELPKLNRALDRNDEPYLAAWARFLSAAGDEDLEALAMEDPVFKQAKDALDRLSADPEARLRAEQREMALFSYELDRAKVRSEGRAEGKAEGRAEGKAEGRAEGKAEGRAEGRIEATSALVRQLLTIKFGELPSDVLQRLAHATEAELQQWSGRLLAASRLDDIFERSPSR